MDAAGRHVLGQKIGARLLGGGKMQAGDCPGQLAVGFFGPGREQVAGAQPRLDMADRDLLVISGQRCCQRGRCIAVHQHDIGLEILQGRLDPGQDLAGDARKRLPRLHDVEVVVRHDFEQAQHLIEHFAVLRGHADARVEPFGCRQLLDERGHLDGFGASTENGQNAACHGGLRSVYRARTTRALTAI